MLRLNVKSPILYQLQQNLFADGSEISCDDPVILLRLPLKVKQVLADRIAGRRCHARAHVHIVAHAPVDNLPGCNAADPHVTILCSKDKRTAPGHGPRRCERPLTAVTERETKFFLRTCEVARGHSRRMLCKASSHAHRRERQGFRTG